MRQFTHINDSFRCVHCKREVQPSSHSCRNHCPYCLYSVHLDVFPGDRLADCGGLMKPIRIEYHTKKGYRVVHRCLNCGHVCRNILQQGEAVQPDNQDVVFHLMAHPED